MFYYRASNLARGKLKDTTIPSWDAQLGALAGSTIHAALEKKHEGMGRSLGQEQIVFATNSNGTAEPLQGILSGTPDMFWVKNSILHVVD